MTIVSSDYVADAQAQPDGSVYVTELHTDSTGKIHRIGPYRVPQGFDMQGRLANQAAYLQTLLAEDELMRLVSNGA